MKGEKQHFAQVGFASGAEGYEDLEHDIKFPYGVNQHFVQVKRHGINNQEVEPNVWNFARDLVDPVTNARQSSP